MAGWTADELDAVDAHDEVRVASTRPDGTLRPAVVIWGVRVGDAVYVRSAYGTENGWFRRARASGAGRFEVAGRARDVTFEVPSADVHADVDAAYHRKYDKYGPQYLRNMVGPGAVEVTLRVAPREAA